MVDRKTKIIATLARQEQERAWLFEKADILDHLESETGICGERFHVSSSELWGARHIWLGDSMGFNKISPSFQDLRALVALIKPEPLVLIKSGCTSFHPVETLTEKDTQYGTVTDVIPFTVRLERNNRPSHVATVLWYGKLLGKLYRIEIHFSNAEKCFGNIFVQYNYVLGNPVGIKVCYADWKFGDLMRDPLKVVGKAKQLKWHSGDPLIPNDYTRYWEVTDKRYTVTPLDLLKNMEGVCV